MTVWRLRPPGESASPKIRCCEPSKSVTILLACFGGGLLRGLSDKPLPFGGFEALIGPSVGLSTYEVRVGLPGVGEALSPR